MALPIIDSLDELIYPIYNSAATQVMDVYHSDNLETKSKEDNSPVTAADLLSHQAIKLGLESITKDIPVLSEEEKYPSSIPKEFWLIDPLDGTKEFINKSNEFTLNIALISNGIPVYGFVGAPAMNLVWTSNTVKHQALSNTSDLPKLLRVVGSKSHKTDQDTTFAAFLKEKGIDHQYKSYGSSLKICMLATGDADIYPRFGPTSEWDIAAAHAILLAAGGDILDISSMKTLEYGKKDTILNPYFVAFGASIDITEVGKIFNEFS